MPAILAGIFLPKMFLLRNLLLTHNVSFNILIPSREVINLLDQLFNNSEAPNPKWNYKGSGMKAEPRLFRSTKTQAVRVRGKTKQRINK